MGSAMTNIQNAVTLGVNSARDAEPLRNDGLGDCTLSESRLRAYLDSSKRLGLPWVLFKDAGTPYQYIVDFYPSLEAAHATRILTTRSSVAYISNGGYLNWAH